MGTLSNNALIRLTSLIDIISPSMQENEMTSFLKENWSEIEPNGYFNIDAIGNLEFSVRRGDSFPTLALIAHTDTICIQIIQAVGIGKYKFRSIGCSPQMLLGQSVVIINEYGQKINGVIGFDATSQFGQPKGLVFEDLWIDLINADNCKSIEIGDLAVLKPKCLIDERYITSTSLDDRLGLYVIGETLRWYSQSDVPLNLICVATAQEEVGLRGSLAFKFKKRPDAIIVLDVDYATDIPNPHEDQMGRLYLGQGPGVLRKADNSSLLRNYIKMTASNANIPLQVSLGRFLYGGTDCSSIQVMREVGGLHVANITLPVRYMHSPIETASLSDVANAIDLIKSVIEKMSTNIAINS